MGMVKKIKCRNCKRLFVPDCRNRNRQRYCKNSECRKKAKAAGQQKWLQKPENKNYFKGPLNTLRVQEWRRQHPGYWKRSFSNKQNALQDRLNAQHSEINKDNSDFTNNMLQDSLIIQPAVIIGLISQFTGSALQDDIVKTLRRMQQLGQDVLSCQFNGKGENYDCKACDFTEPVAQSP
ncbi:MAG: hypothetical protein KKC46_10465 [Proteobacteria bacterium]|nr:hypothetical protein [Pseudomonadota bacterium]